MGFLTDKRRLNVSLTRAKYALWILGNSDVLVKNHHWRYKYIIMSRNLIEDAKKRGCYKCFDKKRKKTENNEADRKKR